MNTTGLLITAALLVALIAMASFFLASYIIERYQDVIALQNVTRRYCQDAKRYRRRAIENHTRSIIKLQEIEAYWASLNIVEEDDTNGS